jgi:hypothetical protein
VKKILILIPILASLLLCINCSSDPVSITERIEALEDAINTHNFQAYYECFDESTSLYNTYSVAQFDIQYPGGIQYYFSSDVTITGNTATVISTKSTTGSTTYNNVFEMVNNDGDYYIKLWTEGTTDIIYKKK